MNLGRLSAGERMVGIENRIKIFWGPGAGELRSSMGQNIFSRKAGVLGADKEKRKERGVTWPRRDTEAITV